MRALVPTMAAALALTAVLPGPTAAAHERAPREVTHGHLETLPGGVDLGYDVRGLARMVRVGDADHGVTMVVVRARGLDPDTTYPTHVHNQPCSATPAGGGHYQHVVGGPVDDANEMWPVIATDGRGRGTGHAVHAHRARPDARSIVIHHPADTSVRLACLDLS